MTYVKMFTVSQCKVCTKIFQDQYNLDYGCRWIKMDWINCSWINGFIMDKMDGMSNLLWMGWDSFTWSGARRCSILHMMLVCQVFIMVPVQSATVVVFTAGQFFIFTIFNHFFGFFGFSYFFYFLIWFDFLFFPIVSLTNGVW